MVNIDSIRPWSFLDHTGKEYMLNTIIIIDPVTGLFKIYRTCSGTSLEASQLFDINWLCTLQRGS